MLELSWHCYLEADLDAALSQCFCLYVLYHPRDGERPYYIGMAKYFGTKQPDGYKASARYNSGYIHLLSGLLREGYRLYIAPIGEQEYGRGEPYEQELIHR